MCRYAKTSPPTRWKGLTHDRFSAPAAAVRTHASLHYFRTRSGRKFGLAMCAPIGACRHAAAAFPTSPFPRKSKRRAKGSNLEKGGHPACFCRRGRAGSANNSWFSARFARKSLIPEASAATSHPAFATSRPDFATSPIFELVAVALFFSLSNSLIKKKKKNREEAGKDQIARHESSAFCHQSQTLPIFWATSFWPRHV